MRRLFEQSKWASDARLADLLHETEDAVHAKRMTLNVKPVYKRVDTCAAEFEAHTPYLYSTYEDECEAMPSARKKVVILGEDQTESGRGSNLTTVVSMPYSV